MVQQKCCTSNLREASARVTLREMGKLNGKTKWENETGNETGKRFREKKSV